ncbi:hypothetical protein GTA62_21165 [Roseobacter sp. HKCCD9010]|uniref:hypothetical protein n=1 Tax=unclassified Roseobacter TaxID=196798 RepID=UPI001491C379|nr:MULTISPECIES: hypothetical protein [unclassified Roseobacter]MBF9052520.1 hypothetical protein [Rhodobacterales bacterium HKCCD4356]NNV14455.1 hypothetical protein [Roseobacter sp. HKCCD7357]NNV18721.1 hypothetical protein [Roseobacter sp. HKCCD8768]NNV28136.1 hypothetical protein [Roseobacter sp. HKCCD8192]NNV32449.1 hypothetical protein [Roseobacter sp. HKCCD9061]
MGRTDDGTLFAPLCGIEVRMKDFNPVHCGRTPDPKDCYVSELGLTLEAELALTVARLFFQSFASPNSNAWVAAMAEAEARFGYRDGPIIAARILATLQVIRRARKSVFMFNSPTCPGCAGIATEHERRLMGALVNVRRGEMGHARLEIMMLCEGNRVEIVLSALIALARALDGELPENSHPKHETRV